jgi:hypothetical protein
MTHEHITPFITDPNPNEWHRAVRIDPADPRFPDDTRVRVLVEEGSGIEFAFGHDSDRRFMYASEITSDFGGAFRFDDAFRLVGTEDHTDPNAPLLIEGRGFRMNTYLPILGRQSFRNLSMSSNIPLNQFIPRDVQSIS